MKITKAEIIGIILGVIFLSLATCYLQKTNQTKHEIKVDTLSNRVSRTENLLNDTLQLKVKIGAKIKKTTDSANKVINSLNLQIFALKQRVSESNVMISKLSTEQKAQMLSEIIQKDTTKALENLVNSGKKDSVIDYQNGVIGLQDEIIILDSSALSICNSALSACLSANNAKKELIAEVTPKHPKLKRLFDKVMKPIKIVGGSIVGALATIGGITVWQVLK